jgi:hypothetical protein
LYLEPATARTRVSVDIFPNLNLPVIYVAQPYGRMDPAQMVSGAVAPCATATDGSANSQKHNRVRIFLIFVIWTVSILLPPRVMMRSAPIITTRGVKASASAQSCAM